MKKSSFFRVCRPKPFGQNFRPYFPFLRLSTKKVCNLYIRLTDTMISSYISAYFKYQTSIFFFHGPGGGWNGYPKHQFIELSPFLLPHNSKSIKAMHVILSHATKGLYVTMCVKWPLCPFTWQLHDLKVGSEPQIWQICDLELYSHFHSSKSKKFIKLNVWNIQMLWRGYIYVYSNFTTTCTPFL